MLKIGFTDRNPKTRADELYKTGVPFPFKIEFVKYVDNPKGIENSIHLIFNKHRVNNKREFFKIPLEKAKSAFDSLDGDYWTDNDEKLDIDENNDENTDENNDENNDENTDENNNENNNRNTKIPENCFDNKQLIRHKCKSTNDFWIGEYDKGLNVIHHNTIQYTSLSRFAGEHYKNVRPDRGHSANGWDECEYQLNGNWISTSTINRRKYK